MYFTVDWLICAHVITPVSESQGAYKLEKEFIAHFMWHSLLSCILSLIKAQNRHSGEYKDAKDGMRNTVKPWLLTTLLLQCISLKYRHTKKGITQEISKIFKKKRHPAKSNTHGIKDSHSAFSWCDVRQAGEMVWLETPLPWHAAKYCLPYNFKGRFHGIMGPDL